jgi:hypothetical protein
MVFAIYSYRHTKKFLILAQQQHKKDKILLRIFATSKHNIIMAKTSQQITDLTQQNAIKKFRFSGMRT